MTAAAATFWASSALIAYAYVLFPALLVALAKRRGRAPRCGDETPPVTVVIAACNEAARITARIDDLLAQDYPADRLHVLVADDGSRDGTADVARAHRDPRVRVVAYAENRGKSATLTDAVATVATPVVAFADARQRFAPDVLRKLAGPLADPAIGAVTGELVLEADAGDEAAASVGLYWRMEKAVRGAEAELGVLPAVTGAIYAMRRALFDPMPRGVILDDMWQPTAVLLAGQRVWMARDAYAYDRVSGDAGLEFRRKLRTLAGNWQLMHLKPAMLLPWRNRAFFAWFSHKFLRLVVPWALLAALTASALADGTFYRAAFAAQLAFYAIAALALARPAAARRIPLSGTAAAFTLLNLAALLSLPAALTTDTATLWRRH